MPPGKRTVSKKDISRRRFIGTGAAAGAALAGGAAAASGATPGSPGTRTRTPDSPGTRTRRADVVVVGAGFAGLTAARELVKKGKSVIVLEARNRVGGRALNKTILGGDVSERGATFAGPTQDHILALAKEMGVKTFPTFNQGDNVYFADGTKMTYSDQSPLGTAPPDPLITADIAQAVLQLDQMSTEVPVGAPWTSPRAEEWDRQTLDSWIRDNSPNPRFYRIIPVATRPIFGAEPRDLSLLFVLFYIAASGNEQNPGTFERNFNTRDGAQMFRFHGGTQTIPLKMAARLGSRVMLRAPVRRITQDSRGVHVYTHTLKVDAKRVIVAIPPTLASRIEYRPILPEGRDQLTQRLPMGTLIKVTAVYDRPFWREQGLNGTAVSLNGPVNVTYDDTPPSGTPGVLFGFVGGDEARRFIKLSSSNRRAAALKSLVDYFGSAAGRPREYFETNWTREEWTRGSPVAIAGPGTLVAGGAAIRQSVGRIHWAGTETAGFWVGYMDGAVRSGKRAAREVLARL